MAVIAVDVLADEISAAYPNRQTLPVTPAARIPGCLGELAASLARQPDTEPLAAGELTSSGALPESQFLSVGQRWTATVDGLDLPSLPLRIG